VNSNLPQILLAASVPVHFRAFHLPWVKRLRELGCIVHGAADRISEMPECVAAFNEVHDIAFPRSPLKFAAAHLSVTVEQGRAVRWKPDHATRGFRIEEV
jgi:hypothetical protein